MMDAEQDNQEDQTRLPKKRASRPSTKGSRYVIERVETGISSRTRRDGNGKPSYDVQVSVDGTAVSKTFKKLTEARAWRKEMLGRRYTGTLHVPRDRRIRVSAFVAGEWHRWLNQRVTLGRMRESTVLWYQAGSRRLVDEIGNKKMVDVSGTDLSDMVERRINAGDSASVIRQLRMTTRSVMKVAVQIGNLVSDPSAAIFGDGAPELPGTELTGQAWSADQAQTFLDHVQGDPFEPLWVLLLGTGLRRGEALGLRWSDLDLDSGVLTVARSLGVVNGEMRTSPPKTENSARTISIGPKVVDALRSRRSQQARDRLATIDWNNADDYVFTTPNGNPVRPEYATRRLKKTVEQARLPWITLHGLRHTSASLALQNGVDIATVSQRLGHRNPAITLRIYVHGSSESDRAAAATIESALAAL